MIGIVIVDWVQHFPRVYLSNGEDKQVPSSKTAELVVFEKVHLGLSFLIPSNCTLALLVLKWETVSHFVFLLFRRGCRLLLAQTWLRMTSMWQKKDLRSLLMLLWVILRIIQVLCDYILRCKRKNLLILGLDNYLLF